MGPQYQEDPSALQRLYVGGSNDVQVPLSEFATLQPRVTNLSINHQGQFPSVTLSYNLEPGASLGDSVSQIKAAEKEVGLPKTVQSSFQGTTQAFETSLSTEPILIAAALFAVYIILGILYESFIHPITILLSLPSAMAGALFFLWIFGFDISVIAIIGLLMLIGIVKKNAIMMIDFALERIRNEDKSTEDAIFEAAALRFRPILMTTLAAVLGTLPIAIGIGAGSELRQPLGVAVVAGLIVSQVLTLYTIPATFIYMQEFGRVDRTAPP